MAQVVIEFQGRDNASDEIRRLREELRRLQRETERTNRQGRDTGERFRRTGDEGRRFNTILTGLRGALISVGGELARFTLPAIAESVTRQALVFDSLRNSMIALTGSVSQANREIAALNRLARLPGITRESAGRAAIQLRAIGVEGQRARNLIRELGNALALTGGSDLSGLVRAFTQIASRGEVLQEEINQIVERAPILAMTLRDAFGVATAEGIRQALAGEGVEAFFERFTAAAGGLGRAPEQGAANVFQNFTNALNEFQATLGQQFLPQLVEVTQALTRIVEFASEFIGRTVTELPPRDEAVTDLTVQQARLIIEEFRQGRERLDAAEVFRIARGGRITQEDVDAPIRNEAQLRAAVQLLLPELVAEFTEEYNELLRRAVALATARAERVLELAPGGAVGGVGIQEFIRTQQFTEENIQIQRELREALFDISVFRQTISRIRRNIFQLQQNLEQFNQAQRTEQGLDIGTTFRAVTTEATFSSRLAQRLLAINEGISANLLRAIRSSTRDFEEIVGILRTAANELGLLAARPFAAPTITPRVPVGPGRRPAVGTAEDLLGQRRIIDEALRAVVPLGSTTPRDPIIPSIQDAARELEALEAPAIDLMQAFADIRENIARNLREPLADVSSTGTITFDLLEERGTALQRVFIDLGRQINEAFDIDAGRVQFAREAAAELERSLAGERAVGRVGARAITDLTAIPADLVQIARERSRDILAVNRQLAQEIEDIENSRRLSAEQRAERIVDAELEAARRRQEIEEQVSQARSDAYRGFIRNALQGLAQLIIQETQAALIRASLNAIATAIGPLGLISAPATIAAGLTAATALQLVAASFHNESNDMLARAAGFNAARDQLFNNPRGFGNQSAQDLVRETSAGFREGLRSVMGPPGGQNVAVNVMVEFDDGTIRTLNNRMTELANEGRL